jgi:hypothetical protein
LPNGGDALRMAVTFALTLVAWVFFRAASLGEAARYLSGMFTRWTAFDAGPLLLPLGLAGALLAVEWVQRERAHGLDVAHLPRPMRWAVCYAVLAVLAAGGSTGAVPFIYFQF